MTEKKTKKRKTPALRRQRGFWIRQKRGCPHPALRVRDAWDDNYMYDDDGSIEPPFSFCGDCGTLLRGAIPFPIPHEWGWQISGRARAISSYPVEVPRPPRRSRKKKLSFDAEAYDKVLAEVYSPESVANLMSAQWAFGMAGLALED